MDTTPTTRQANLAGSLITHGLEAAREVWCGGCGSWSAVCTATRCGRQGRLA